MKKFGLIMIFVLLVLSACTTEVSPTSVVEQITEVQAEPQATEIPASEEVVEKEVMVEETEPLEIKQVIIEATEMPVDENSDCPICGYDMSQYTGLLNHAEVEGLLLALNDEYRAWAIYDQVLLDFGMETRPFSNIRESEATHFVKLIDLFIEYDLEVPENPWIGNAPSYDSTTDACIAGVGAEIENVALYDQIFSSTNNEDILTVYEALKKASLDKHLPAFERCGGNR